MLMGLPFSRFPVRPERSEVFVKEDHVRRVGAAFTVAPPKNKSIPTRSIGGALNRFMNEAK
jgi:hypothetical protein